jgi:hypothetical protein
MSSRMADPEAPTAAPRRSVTPTLLVGAGLAFLAIGVVLALVYILGSVRSSLFPTGWLFPAVLIASGALMAARRRFDVVVTLWASLTIAVFVLDALIYMNALDHGLDDASAFDAALIVAGFGFVALVLRPGFRS